MAQRYIDTALTTTAAVKVYLGVENTSKDTQIDALVSRYSGIVSTFCGRKFAQTTYTDEVHSGNGSENMWLHNWPVTSPVTSIHLDASGFWGASNLLVERSSTATGDFWVVPGEESQGRVVRINGVWSAGHANVKASYQAGYATIPGPVIEAVHIMIARVWAITEKRAHALGSESNSTGGSTSYLERRIHDDVREMLMPWKKMRIFG